MVEICYALYDKDGHYAKIVGTSMQSVIINTRKKVRFHIIHDDTLNKQNKHFIIKLCNERGIEVCFYNVQRINLLKKMFSCLQDVWLRYYSPAVLYRLIIWEVLPYSVNKIIYLDADTLVYLDIDELWQLDSGMEGIAAAIDTLVAENPQKHSLYNEGIMDYSHYFNSGVLLMQRSDKYKSKEIIGGILEFFKNYPLASFPDQDALNFLFKHAIILPGKFNRLVGYERLNLLQLEDGIYHFSGESFSLSKQDQWMRLWWSYFCRTPWCNDVLLERLMSVTLDVNIKCRMEMRTIFNTVIEKKVVVVYEEAYREDIIKEIGVGIAVEMIPCTKVLDFIPEFAKAVEQLEDEVVFIFFVDDFKYLHDSMIKMGSRNTNFLDGRIMLSPDSGGYSLDENRIVMGL